MLHYVLRRLGLFLLALVVTSLGIFALLRVLPGDVAQVIGGIKATPEQLARIRTSYGLDRPLPAQYLDWVGGCCAGTWATPWSPAAPSPTSSPRSCR